MVQTWRAEHSGLPHSKDALGIFPHAWIVSTHAPKISYVAGQ